MIKPLRFCQSPQCAGAAALASALEEGFLPALRAFLAANRVPNKPPSKEGQ